MTRLKLQTLDKQVFEVNKSVARKFDVLKTMIEDLAIEDTSTIPLTTIEGPIFEYILRWAEKEDNASLTQEVKDDFFPEDMDILYKILMSANFLMYDSFLKGICEHLAKLINNCKTVDELKLLFKL